MTYRELNTILIGYWNECAHELSTLDYETQFYYLLGRVTEISTEDDFIFGAMEEILYILNQIEDWSYWSID